MASARSFILGGVNLLYVIGVARRAILIGIAGRVHELASIVARTDTT